MAISSYSVSGNDEGRRDLRLTIAPDGSAEAAGAVLFPSGHGFVALEAEPGTARCTCADPNGNGRVGLTQVAFQARDPRSGEFVPVVLTPPDADDIDRAGRYEIEVRVGDERATLTADVRPLRGRRKRRRRRRRRNH